MSAFETLDAMFHQLTADLRDSEGQREGETEREYWCRQIEDGIAYVRHMNLAYARAEWAYRKAKARAWAEVKAEGGRSAKHQEEEVNARTADDRYLRDLAQGEKQGALDSLRARAGELSAWQTDRKVGAEEEGHALYGPEPDRAPPRPAHPAEVAG